MSNIQTENHPTSLTGPLRYSFIDQVSGTLLEENQVRSVVEGVKEVIVASANRRIERTARAKAEDFDSEEEELLREENEQEDEIFDQVSY